MAIALVDDIIDNERGNVENMVSSDEPAIPGPFKYSLALAGVYWVFSFNVTSIFSNREYPGKSL